MTVALRSGSVIVSIALVLGTAGLARADCTAEFSALMSKRMAQIATLNKNSKSHGGKLDPVAACPQLRNLAAAESEVVAYLDKNKEWCGFPDDMAEKMTATRAKTQSYAANACGVAVKMKQMQAQQQKQAQSQQQQEPAIKLPTGPL